MDSSDGHHCLIHTSNNNSQLIRILLKYLVLRKGEQLKTVQKSEFNNLEQEMKSVNIGKRIEELDLK